MEKQNLLHIDSPNLGKANYISDFHKIYVNDKIGDKFKHDFKGYKCFVFSGDLDALKHLGLKASSKIKLYNGSIECRLNKYDVY